MTKRRSAAALAALRREPLALEYPLIEDEVAARQRVEIVDVARSRARAAPGFTAVLGWSSYVVAPLAVHGKTVGLLHADAGAAGARSTRSTPRWRGASPRVCRACSSAPSCARRCACTAMSCSRRSSG